jgi:hypothetical protein
MTDDEIYATIFIDGSGWVQFDRRHYDRQYAGVRYGAVLATDSPSFTKLALNEKDTNRGLAAKRDGKVDRMRVVPAKRNGVGRYEYCGSIDIEVLYEKVLKNMPPSPACQSAEIIRDGRGLDFRSLLDVSRKPASAPVPRSRRWRVFTDPSDSRGMLRLTLDLSKSVVATAQATNRAFGRFRLPKHLRYQMQTPKS